MTRLARRLRALFVVGWKEALAYRTELLVWILATTMPLVMLLFFRAATEGGPLQTETGPLTGARVTAYFLAMFVVRQFCGSWAAWQMNEEIRDGTLALRLLRPVHPFLPWATEQLAYVPLRGALALASAGAALAGWFRAELCGDGVLLALLPVSLLAAFVCTYALNLLFGSLAFWTTQSVKAMDSYNAVFFVLSGYLVPVRLFPARLQAALEWLPFRYQIGVPVELLTGEHGRAAGVLLVAKQVAMAAVLMAAATAVFHRGLRRFEAVGG